MKILHLIEAWCFAYLRGLGLITFCSDSPDTSGINAAAVKSADLGEQALNWWKQVYTDQAPARERASQLAEKVAGAQLSAMDTQTRIASEADEYNRSTFRPLEREIVADARNFDTDAERERLAGLAGADVAQAFGAARSQGVRQLGRMGVNTSDGRMLGTLRDLAATEALGTAFAKNKARQDSLTLGRALKMDAASLGRGLPGQQATATSLSLNAGNNAVGNAQVPLQIADQGARQVGQGFDAAQRGYQTSGNLYGQVANIQSREGDGMLGGLAQLGMAAGGLGWKPFASDKNQKKGRKAVKGEEALTLARKMPVERWKYRDDSPAADGGQEHIGPMAQDAHAAGGESLAPGGKTIDPITMHGVTLAAVQALDKKVARIEKRAA